MSSRRIGYFGGTFDPPHLGHEILAQEAVHQLALEKLMWLITPQPPHKRSGPITPVKSRLDMLDLVVKDCNTFEISRVDLNRPAPHYAADTLEIIKKDDPTSELVYIIGEDSLEDLPGWYQPQRIIKAVDVLAVATRPGINTDMVDLEKLLPGLQDKIRFLTGVMVEISSSLIRKRVREGGPYRHFLASSVADYLEMNKLYQT